MLRWGFAIVALVAITGCYSPNLESCNIECSDGDSCPDGMSCVPGLNRCRPIGGDSSACGTPDGPPGQTGRLFKKITAGGRHACAIDVAGALVCWGANEHGQLTGSAGLPQQIGIDITEPAVTSWVEISGGGTHTCGIGLDGAQTKQLFCWGDNANLQVASNGMAGVNPAHQIDLAGFVAAEVSAGFDHTCAVTETGELFCWGANDERQLGNTTVGGTATPTQVPKQVPDNWVHVDAGTKTTCATTDGGKLFCWGRNSVGQLGNGATIPGLSTEVPQEVMLGPDPSIRMVSVGFQHVCALRTTDVVGTIKCWGTDLVGQVGRDVSIGANYSVPQIPGGVGSSTFWGEIRTGDAMSCAIKEGQVYCWGLQGDDGALGDHCVANNNSCRTMAGPLAEFPVVGLMPIESTAFTLAVGEQFGCALFGDPTAGGVARCWGSNSDGQLANSGISQLPTASEVVGGPWKVIRAGRDFACGIKADDTVWCWGANHKKQAANSDEFFEPSPVQRLGVANAIDLAVGEDHACALVSTTSQTPVLCWGSDVDSELGDPENNLALESPILPDVGQWASITAAGNVTCIEHATNPAQSVCWGDAPWALRGLGSPRTVGTGDEAFGTTLRLGTNTACFEKGGNTMQCYGSDELDQRGDGGGTPAMDKDPATSVVLAGTTVDIVDHSGGAFSGRHHCGIQANTASVFCFGANERNQINDTSAQTFAVGSVINTNGAANGTAIKADVTNLSPTSRHIAAGGDFTCAILEGGAVSCWGDNTGFQCTSTGADVFTGAAGIPTPIATAGAGTYTSITAGDFFACGIQSDGKAYCWGFSPKGQSGTGRGGADQNYYEDVRTLDPGM